MDGKLFFSNRIYKVVLTASKRVSYVLEP